jgi:hypothetical protein
MYLGEGTHPSRGQPRAPSVAWQELLEARRCARSRALLAALASGRSSLSHGVICAGLCGAASTLHRQQYQHSIENSGERAGKRKISMLLHSVRDTMRQ